MIIRSRKLTQSPVIGTAVPMTTTAAQPVTFALLFNYKQRHYLLQKLQHHIVGGNIIIYSFIAIIRPVLVVLAVMILVVTAVEDGLDDILLTGIAVVSWISST